MRERLSRISLRFMRATNYPLSQRQLFFYLMASGLVGEPTAPVIGSAGATNMNS